MRLIRFMVKGGDPYTRTGPRIAEAVARQKPWQLAGTTLPNGRQQRAFSVISTTDGNL